MADDWKETSLATVIDVKHGFAFPGENIRDEPPGDILLTPGNFAFGGGFKGDKFKYFDGEVPEDYVLNEGDLIVTMTDLSKQADTLGYPAIVPRPRGQRFLHNQRLGKVLIKSGVELDQRFLFYLLRTAEYRHEVLASATGTTVKHTSPGRILAHKAKIPLLDKQKAIASVLGALDDKIGLNRRMNETLEALAQTIFKSWIVDAANAKLPKGWREGPILELAKLMSGGTPKTEQNEYWDGDILWASAKDVSQCGQTFLVTTERTITTKGLEESSTQMIPAFCTVVVARGATTGRMVLFGRDMAMNQTCYALANTTGTPFALYCMTRQKMSALVQTAHGSVFDTITTSSFASQKIALPPQEILQQFEKVVSPLFQRILANTKESRTLAALRDTLLPKLLSGELRVPKTLEIA